MQDTRPARKYSLAEIDRMRRAIEWSFPTGFAYDPKVRAVEIEERLRTAMFAGIEPDELDEGRPVMQAVHQSAGLG